MRNCGWYSWRECYHAKACRSAKAAESSSGDFWAQWGDATLGEVVRGLKELLDALKGSLGEKWKVKITPHLSQDGINITIELMPL